MSDVDKTIESSNRLLQTLSGMPFANMMALMQLLLMTGGLLLAVYVLIPSERKVIMDTNASLHIEHQKQIDRVVTEHQKQVDRVVEQHADSIERVTSTFERTLDRVMNRPNHPVAAQP